MINTREQLAKVFFGRGVELGVARGDYSCEILKNPNVDLLFSIDRWSDHHDRSEYRHAKAQLAKYGDRSIVVRQTFEDAEKWACTEDFDFVYIDGYAHTGQDSGRTLRDWYPKLKPGGIFAGHDYHERWKPTMIQVDVFATSVQPEELFVTKDDEYPSWWFIKPESSDDSLSRSVTDKVLQSALA